VLKHLDLKIPKGTFYCIIGEVGSGKSSLLNALIGDLVFLNNETLGAISETDRPLTEAEKDIIKENFMLQKFLPVRLSCLFNF